MNFKNHFLFLFFFLFCIADAFDITQFLSQYPDFSTFNNYLTQTQVAAQINSRRTITVLVVDNGNMATVSGKTLSVLKNIMSVHVILDYYDVKKLQNLPKKTTILTTLFQTTGKAIGQQGFLNVTDLNTGSVVFGSAVKGATLDANLVKPIAAQPYNVSILQISTVILPLGIDNSTSTPSPPNKSPPPAPSPAPEMTPSTSPPSPPPKKSPVVSPPKPSKAPVPSPPEPDADAPDADADADAPAADNPPSLSSNLKLSIGAIFMIVSSAVWTVAMT